MSQYLYIHIQHNRTGDDETTVRLGFIAGEAARSVLARAAADATLAARLRAMITAGAYDLQLQDDGPALDAGYIFETYPDGGDLFAMLAPARSVYVSSVDVTGIPDATARVSVFNGVTTYAEVLQKFCEAATIDEVGAEKQLAISLDGLVPVCANMATPVCNLADKSDLSVIRVAKAPPKQTGRVSLSHPLAFLAQQEIDRILKIVIELQSRKQFAKGCILLTEMLEKLELDESTSEPRITAHKMMGDMKAEAGMNKEAAECYKEALKLLPLNKQPQMLRSLGIALHDAQDYNAAYAVFNTCLETNRRSKGSLTTADITEVKIRLGASMFMSGLVDQGIAIVQETLGGDIKNDLGVYWMSRFFLSKNYNKDAISWSVQLLVRHSKDADGAKLYRQNFATMMASIPESVEILRSVLVADDPAHKKDVISAWGFLCVVLKDFGLLDIALELYKYAYQVDPTKSGLILDNAHALETVCRPVEGLILLKAFLTRMNSVVVGKVSCREVAELVGDLTRLPREYPIHPQVIVKRLNAPRKILRVDMRESITLYTAVEDAPPPGRTIYTNAEQEIQVYDQTQLELLAVMFATVKDYYCLGLLDRCVPLLNLVNPMRVGNAIHRTHIRNESAYFSSIALLLQHHDQTPETPPVTFQDVLYVVGDSHVLATAWKTINIQGRRTVCVPGLVTGLKLWHLRDEGVFYPKKQFELVIDGIPKGSDVMFIIGEIDCREGIVPSVDKGIYPTIDAAMNFLAQLYLKVLLKMRKRFGRIFVHQPPAAIDVTRHLVVPFHKVLAQVLEPYKDELYVVNPDVYTADLQSLKPRYELDQTHFSPLYVEVLEEAINTVLDSEELPPLASE